MNTQLRPAQPEDLARIRELIVELAIYEKEPDAVKNTVEMMRTDGFGEHPVFGCIVAEHDQQIVGAAIYYYRYSTWKGKRMYLEDLIVTEKMRGKGLGQLLFEEVIAIGKRTQCTGMMWQVLDWNASAIEFYKRYDTHFSEEWVNCNLDW